MELQEQRQPELVKKVAKVKARTRPWKAIIALILAAIAAGVSYAFGHNLKSLFEPGHLGDSITASAAALAFFVFASIAVVAFARRAREALQSVTGSTHAEMVRYAIVLVGGILTIVITLLLFKIPVTQLLVGGAFAAVIVSIAGQQSLSNIFAGVVLLWSRPFLVGDTILLRSGALGGQHEGIVTEIGITYLKLRMEDGVVSLPNSQVLAAAVRRQPAAAEPADPQGGAPGGPPLPAVAAASGTEPVTGAIEPSGMDTHGH